MKNLSLAILIFCLLFLVIGASGQETPSQDRQWGRYKETGLTGGLLVNRDGQKRNTSKYGIELGIQKSVYTSHQHGMTGYWYHFSNELLPFDDSYLHGFKVGAAISWIFFLGADFVLYTDFNKVSPQLAPSFGLGSHILQIGMGGLIPLSDDHLGMNSFHFRVVYRFHSLKSVLIEPQKIATH